MLAASFEDDFAQFLVRGRIGSDPQLSMVPVDPQLGDWVEIRCQGLEAGQLCGADGQRWAVVEGSTVRCQVTGPMSWSLRSASGVPLCSLQVEPHVVVPRLLDWGCASQIGYDQAALPIHVRAEHAQSVSLAWRLAGHPTWNELPAGSCSVPVPDQLAELELRAVLRSAHADLSPTATVVLFHRVAVRHPALRLAVQAPARAARFDSVVLSAQALWAERLVLQIDAQRVELRASAPGEQLSAQLPVPTGAVGQLSAVVTAHALDGSVQQQTLTVEVCARPVQVEAQPADAGNLVFAIWGAEPVSIEFPSRGYALPLHDAQGVLQHGFFLPTLLNIVVRDDMGHIHRHALVLDAMHHVWGTLPSMKPLRWSAT